MVSLLSRSTEFERALQWKLQIIFLAILLIAGRAYCTTIDPLTWEQIAIGADFIGVVECEEAGGIVAKYKVIDGWKGVETGKTLNIRISPDAWGPQFPTALCGERFLIAGYKTRPETMMSTTGYGPVPLWWRNIPAEYETPLFQGLAKLPLVGRESLSPFGTTHQNLESFKEDLKSLLGSSPVELEDRMLRAQANKYLNRNRFLSEASDPDGKKRLERLIELADAVEQAKGLTSLLQVLLSPKYQAVEEAKWVIPVTLSRGGRQETLKAIEALTDKEASIDQKERVRIAAAIRRRLGEVATTTQVEKKAEQPPSPAQLQEWRKLVQKYSKLREVGQAIEPLTKYDPEPLAEFLVKWVNPNEHWSDQGQGYALGSYFGWRCGKNREENLRKLLSAHDPFIQVAGAVYLCFDNPEAGRDKLRELMKLEGTPGAWAALTLARRGDKSAIPRALKIFADPGDPGMAGMTHGNLKLQVIVFLSNTSKRSGLPQPVLPSVSNSTEDGKPDPLFTFYQEWWRANEAQIVPDDPWANLLEEQKVD